MLLPPHMYGWCKLATAESIVAKLLAHDRQHLSDTTVQKGVLLYNIQLLGGHSRELFAPRSNDLAVAVAAPHAAQCARTRARMQLQLL